MERCIPTKNGYEIQIFHDNKLIVHGFATKDLKYHTVHMDLTLNRSGFYNTKQAYSRLWRVWQDHDADWQDWM